MLKKLLKYDLLYMYKCLIVFYILSLVCGLCTRIFDNAGDAMILIIIAKIFSGVAISMMFSIIFNNILRLWARFKINLYGDESYLTHTLPVTKSTHYMSKFLAVIITSISGFVVIIVTLFIAYVESKEQLRAFIDAFIYDDGTIADVMVVVVLLLLEIIHIMQIGYTGIILGNRRINMRIIWSFVYGFIGYIITQVCTLVYVGIMALVNEDLKKMLFSDYGTGETINKLDDTIKFLIYGVVILYIVFIIVFYYVNKKLLNKGVDVD